MITKESVRINLKGVSSVTIDPEVLAEYKTTIEDLEKKLKYTEYEAEMTCGDLEASNERNHDLLKQYQEQLRKVEHYELWRKSL